MPTRFRAIDAELAPEREEFLAQLVEELSECAGSEAQRRLDAMVAQHPDLAGQLRELFATMSMADAVAEESTIMLPPGVAAKLRQCDDPRATLPMTPTVPAAPVSRPGAFVPGATPLPALGVVYRAVQLSLGRTVAVKMLLRRDLASPADLSRFRSEAEAAARLDHPGIVPIFEVGEHDGLPFYSMRLIEGTTLAKRLAAGPLPSRESAALLAKVADAMQAAHDRGVLHRDLKPSNILIDTAGEPLVSDFGLAKRLEDSDSVTHTGAILGTPCYMSPEQAAGSRGDVGPASDVWSLGAILYQTICGRPPFQASTPMDTLLAVLEADPPAPRSVSPAADRDLEMIALKSLQKPQDLRYVSAAALAADLRAALAGEPIAARTGGLADVVARLFRETHHAVVLENWGLLWMWHSVVVLALCCITDVLAWQGLSGRWPYLVLWGGGLALWAPIVWALRHRNGPVTAVERQVAHVWGGSMIASTLLFAIEQLLGLPVLTLSPVLALFAGLVFFVKAGILSGVFYVQSAALFATALVMCLVPEWQHVIFGLVSGACFFVPGLKYFRQRNRPQ
jgi:serine/threonine-protein kinase